MQIQEVASDLLQPEEDAPHPAPVFSQMPADRAWASPLVGAALSVLVSGDWSSFAATRVNVVTPWDRRAVMGDRADPLKHEQYCDSTLTAIQEAAPGLVNLLAAAGATLIIFPGGCGYSLPADESAVHHMAHLVHLTHFLPWKTADDSIAH